MEEAKARNPDIKLYGLSWAVPGWIGDGCKAENCSMSDQCDLYSILTADALPYRRYSTARLIKAAWLLLSCPTMGAGWWIAGIIGAMTILSITSSGWTAPSLPTT